MRHFESETWHDSPDGYRFSLTDVNDAAWVMLTEAVELLRGYPAPGGSALSFLAWRIEHGTISSKAAEITVSYGDDPDYILYRNMPITNEWSTALWQSETSEHWTTNELTTTTSEFGRRLEAVYSGIAVDRKGIERLVAHLQSLNSDDRISELVKTGDPGRPPKGREFYMAEFERRLANGSMLRTVQEEAVALRDWFKINHSAAALPALKTIANNIRPKMRGAGIVA